MTIHMKFVCPKSEKASSVCREEHSILFQMSFGAATKGSLLRVVKQQVERPRCAYIHANRVRRWLTLSSMSCNDNKNNNDDDDDNNNTVALVWKPSEGADHPLHRTIHLGEVANAKLSSRKEDHTAAADAMKAEADDDIPFSVLEFERQKRKAQHTKKVGTVPSHLDVVYQDDDIVVVNKPPGVLTVPGVNQHGCLLDLVFEQFGFQDENRNSSLSEDDDNDNAASQEQPNKVHMIVHRLDMDTSGLVVFGRTRDITLRLHEQFRDRKVHKEYRAAVMGHWPVEYCNQGLIDLPLQKDVIHPPFMRVATPQSQKEALQALKKLRRAGWIKLVKQAPRPSQSDFQVLSLKSTPVHNLPYTELRLTPATGRTHQLRVHCSAAGFPIVGDATYSLYGEAAPGGGLSELDRLVVLAPDHATGGAQGTLASPPRSIARDSCVPLSIPSQSVQQEWTKAYQPNEKPMCLHASKLSFSHPTRADEIMCFEVEPSFHTFLDQI